MKQFTQTAQQFWLRNLDKENSGVHGAFRGHWEMPAPGQVEIRLIAATSFVAWVNGTFIGDGPARFTLAAPEFQSFHVALTEGPHELAIQVCHLGFPTRLQVAVEPFLSCVIACDGVSQPVRWRCAELAAYSGAPRRINPQLGYGDWCDSRLLPDWQKRDFDDSAWPTPTPVVRPIGPLRALSTGAWHHHKIPGQRVAHGALTQRFGYEKDDPSACFFLREIKAGEPPTQGVWRRYDLGRIRLIRPRFKLDLPAGALVQFAYSESLLAGRVAPWITCSEGLSCNLDHYIARGGIQEFFPHVPKGGRFVEMHIIAPSTELRVLEEQFLERAYFGVAEGSLKTPDELLNRIWHVGVETLRACAEDAIVDNPTRERGEWIGDLVAASSDVAAVTFSDLRLVRRGLVRAAESARHDGLVAAMTTGGSLYLPPFAVQWVSGCLHYWELTGDRSLLVELFQAAQRNMSAFFNRWSADGLPDDMGWIFIDWGYVRNEGPTDMGLVLHYYRALQDMVRWCEAVGQEAAARDHIEQAALVQRFLSSYFERELALDNPWPQVGYHRTVLGLKCGLVRAQLRAAAIRFIMAHQHRCFPNDRAAPRLSSPVVKESRLITPYFAHQAMPLLIEAGEMDFVLAQFRTCWGWALEQGWTTWPEVFDHRWSHCHAWSGAPTWQMSRYLLGLHPRFDLGLGHFRLCLRTGSLDSAEGRLPVGNAGSLAASWHKTDGGIFYRIETPVPIWLHIASATPGTQDQVIAVERSAEFIWPD